MPRVKTIKDRNIETYEHKEAQRLNNPPAGLANLETDEPTKKKTYQYDPHLDPQLQWAGKAERTSFHVDTISLHVHERIDPKTIIQAVRSKGIKQQGLVSFFLSQEENPPLRDAIEFYKHPHGWSNRLISGDSLLVMNSLLEKEGMRGQIQMIYIDPPYGIKYGSNFQPFINKREVTDGKDEDLTQEPEMIKAFRDTWELGIHSYLTYLRDRILLAKELLTESGSIFIQISDQNLHHVRELLDEIFGSTNFCSQISFEKTTGATSVNLATSSDYILWYAKSKIQLKFNRLFTQKEIGGEGAKYYDWIESYDKTIFRRKTKEEKDNPALISPEFRHVYLDNLTSQTPSESISFVYDFDGQKFTPGTRGWRTNKDGLDKLVKEKRLAIGGNRLRFKSYFDDFPYSPLTNNWLDTRFGGFVGESKIYVVQTLEKVIERCILMTTDPGDIVLDPTCGSGTTAYVSEKRGRRWITCDTSRVAVTLSKQRLMTALFDYYLLAYPKVGVGGGFIYNTIKHTTLRSIANNESPEVETLYDQPDNDPLKARVTGPFTVEAVPSPNMPIVKPLTELEKIQDADRAIAREGITIRQEQWRCELLRTGVRGKAGQKIEFTRIEAIPGRWIHADAETKESEPKRALISFGPEYSPLERKQVELAIDEARKFANPKPSMILFASFQFDPVAAKDIDEMDYPGVKLLKVQMNPDLLTEDLKKHRATNESYWLIGQPDVNLINLPDGKLQVEIRGFDYYDTINGGIISGGVQNIAMWMLDTDYDRRSIFPKQVFFPMAGDEEGWSKLARNLKTEIDEDLIEQYRGTKSLPFIVGENKAIAVKIIDDRGIESLRPIEVG